MYRSMIGDTAMLQSLYNTDIGIMQRDIFSDQSNLHFIGGILYHLLPVCQIRLRTIQMQTFTGYLCQMLFFHS